MLSATLRSILTLLASKPMMPGPVAHVPVTFLHLAITMPTRPHLACVLFAFNLLLAPLPLLAQPPATRDSTVRQAAFNRPALGDAAPQTVRFSHKPTRMGDRTEQTLEIEMRLKLTMRRGNDLLGDHTSTVRTSQRRVVTTTAINAGIATAVRVQYPEATKQIVASDAPAAPPQSNGSNDASNAVAHYSPVAEPVQGKTYLCRREPGKQGKLIITDGSGNRPPTDEYDIVARQMDSVGRPNPLAQFLAGRTVAVGETLKLPKDIASKVFNLDDKFGEVTRFTLTLQKVQAENGATCADFLASVEAASTGASQMRLQVEGPLVVQVDTCHAVRIDLNGPVGMSETRGTYSTAYQVIGTGHLRTQVAAVYR